MTGEQPEPAPKNELEKKSEEDVNRGSERRLEPDHDFDVNDLSGKTDSGPEPDIFGREIPPQD